MNDLNRSESELVSLGAAMGSNCVPCIEYHIPEARKAGLTEAQIAAAIRLADKVRQVPARKVLNTAERMLRESPPLCAVDGGAEATTRTTEGQPCCDVQS